MNECQKDAHIIVMKYVAAIYRVSIARSVIHILYKITNPTPSPCMR